MKINPHVVFGVIGGIGGLIGAIYINTLVGEVVNQSSPQHAVCLQSHREVVFIPTICGAHDICQKPVVADVCDRIQAPPPRPMCQGNNNDADP